MMLKALRKRSRQKKRKGFTLVELMLAISIIGTLSAIVASSIDVSSSYIKARDAERKHNQGQIEDAVYQHLIDKWDIPNKEQISSSPDNPTDICRYGLTDPSCVNLDALVDEEFLPELPTDPSSVSPLNGYTIYLMAGRPQITSSHIGEAAVEEGACEDPASFVTSGLLGWWKFDDGAGTTAADSSGNGYDGTLADGEQTTAIGPTWSTDAPSTICTNPYSLQFDGVNDFVRLSPHAALRTYDYTDYTITAWYKSSQTSTSVDQYIFGQYSGSSVPSADKYGMYLSPTDDSGNEDRTRMHVHHNDPVSSTSYGTTDIVDQAWHHLAVVRNGDTREIWVDGVMEGTSNGHFTTTLVDPRDGPTIGAETKTLTPGDINTEEPPHHLVEGWIDDVRVYNRALTNSEIEQIAAGQG